MPEYTQVGKSTYFATTCRECPAGCGLIMRTLEGRAIKAEGNPNHPVNSGKLCSRGLVGVQGLYNPDRFQGPRKPPVRGRGLYSKVAWKDAVTVIKDALQKNQPDEIAFLLGSGPDHLFDFVGQLTGALGAAAPVRYSALTMLEGRQTLAQAAQKVFGAASVPYFDLGGADMAFVFGADLLGTWLSPVNFSRGYSKMRASSAGRGYMVVFDSHMALTGGNADEWYPIIPGSEAILAAGLGKLVAGLRQAAVPAAFSAEVGDVSKATGLAPDVLQHLAELFSRAERPLAIPGGTMLGAENGTSAAQAVLALNALVNNGGKPGGVFVSTVPERTEPISKVIELIAKMQAGKIKVLFVHGCNPVFELPKASGFTEALAKVPQVITFSSFPDETAVQADYIFPDHTPLESFGYQMVPAGSDRWTLSGMQPVVVPLFDTKATVDVLLSAVQGIGGDLAKKISYRDEVDFIQQAITGLLPKASGISQTDIRSFWASWLQHGGWWSDAADLKAPETGRALTTAVEIKAPALKQSDQHLRLVVLTTQLGDGSLANRPWLQETPNPMTTAMWSSWVEMHPETAKRLHIEDDDIVTIQSAAGAIDAIVYLFPAMRQDVVAVPFGQGHTALGRYAQGRGSNPAILLEAKLNDSGDLAFAETLVTVTKTGKKKQLARAESRQGIYGTE
jgi:anaerobic selenocysteine-containing dehydrogenase